MNAFQLKILQGARILKTMIFRGRLFSPLQSFFKTEAAGGILLLVVTILALLWVNSPAQDLYRALLHAPVVPGFDLHHLVNDALMVLFFYVVGLEIKRELLFGSLNKPRDAALPLFAAIGGMIVPAGIYLSLNANPETHAGWGIPMATDIAFAVGIITLFGKRIPLALKAFLLAFAIIDDLGAILVIALFYSKDLMMVYLGGAAAILIVMALLLKSGLRNVFFGVACGVLVWACFLKSGIHATIAGVILAFLTPADYKDGRHRLDHWIHVLHPWVSFAIMPLFALFNAGVDLGQLNVSAFFESSVAQGIVLGLVLGKPIGILVFCALACALKLAKLPAHVGWSHLVATGFLGGIGFTMSLFVGTLAFTHPQYEVISKGAILVASVLAGTIGFVGLRLILRKTRAS